MNSTMLINLAKSILSEAGLIEGQHYIPITRGDGAVILEVVGEYRKLTKNAQYNKRSKNIITVWPTEPVRITIKGSPMYTGHQTLLGENDIDNGCFKREVLWSYACITEVQE